MSEERREASCAAVHDEETDLQRIHRREKKRERPGARKFPTKTPRRKQTTRQLT